MKAALEPKLKEYCRVSFKSLLRVLKKHKIKSTYRTVRKSSGNKYKKLTRDNVRRFDVVAVVGPYGTSHSARKICKRAKVPMFHVQNGFLPDTVIWDIFGFWGDSPLYKNMGHEIEKFTTASCQKWSEKYSNHLVNNNSSRRPQPKKTNKVGKPYVFLPLQYMIDESILKYGTMKYSLFVKKVAAFCKEKDLVLAIKTHPRAMVAKPGEKGRIKKLFKALKRDYPDTFRRVKGSIHELSKNSVCMVSMNSACIVDGMLNGTISVECGKTIFSNSGSIIHDKNIEAGLQKCLDLTKKEKNTMIVKQKAVLYYLYNHYLPLEKNNHKSELSNEQKIENQMRLAKIIK